MEGDCSMKVSGVCSLASQVFDDVGLMPGGSDDRAGGALDCGFKHGSHASSSAPVR